MTPTRAVPVPDQWLDAIHQSGHAIYAALTFGCSSVVEVCLLRNGRRRPDTLVDPGAARLAPIAALREEARYALAGLVAEAIVFGRDGVTPAGRHDRNASISMLRALARSLLDVARVSPITRGVREVGPTSDRASEAIRARFDRMVTREAEVALSDVRAALAGHGDEIKRFATLLHDHPERLLVGEELGAALASALVEPSIASIVH